MAKDLDSSKNDRVAKKYRVAVGLSGGVDSAVSAALLKEAGHEVSGVYLQCWDFDAPGCRGDSDRADAARVASHLGIKFSHLEFIEQYKREVIGYFYDSYEKGLTPNPDILCNTVIKFGLFLNWALENGFDYVATGHYARIQHARKCCQLLSGADASKDQSYFLYRLNQSQLGKALFPLGEWVKEDVRKKAKELSLPVYDKPDSTGICFIGDVDVREFLGRRLKPREGRVVLEDGQEIGRHKGIWLYTIGQRRGFEINRYMGIPLYVVGKSAEKNELIVGPIKSAFRNLFLVEDLHWICEVSDLPLSCLVRIRNLGEFYESRVSLVGTAAVGGLAGDYLSDYPADRFDDQVLVESEKGMFGVAPGQSAVFYLEDRVLGGGIIV